MKKTILVTGGAGYIGSITTKELLDNGFDVVVLDSLENGHVEAVDKRVKSLEIADLKDPEKTDLVFKKYSFDAVIDFAAYLAVGESMIEPKKYLKNNVLNFIHLLDTMVKNNCKFVIKSSTAAVYGNPKDSEPLTEQYLEKTKFDESQLLEGSWNNSRVQGEVFFTNLVDFYENLIKNHPEQEILSLTKIDKMILRNPSNVYGFTKLLDEIIMKKYDILFGIKGVALRYFNVAGAGIAGDMGEDHPVETHLIPLAIQNIFKELSDFKVFGNDYDTPDGTALRDYIHVLDLANGHIRALEYLLKEKTSNTFNLGNGKGYTVLEVLKSVGENTNREVKTIIGPRRSGDPDKLIASPNKAKSCLKWQAKYSLDEMIGTAWHWHSTHPHGYEKV
jgi:UDP-glucose 4-epimerase